MFNNFLRRYDVALTFLSFALIGLTIILVVVHVRSTPERRQLPQPTVAQKLAEPYVYKVVEYQVIDGDTLRTTLDLGFNVYHQVDVRLAGIDAPEVRGAERLEGEKVARHLRELLARQKVLYVYDVQRGKYAGRVIGRIRLDNQTDLSSHLLAQGLVSIYGESQTLTEVEE